MKINTRQIERPINLNVKKNGFEENKPLDNVELTSQNVSDEQYAEFNQKMEALNKGEKFRKAAIMGGSIALGTAIGAAGGLVTGWGGAVIGGVTGLLGGAAAGSLAGSLIGEMIDPHAGSGALAYLGIGMVGGAAAGAIGGAIAGFGSSAVIGGISGALGGAYIGYTLHYANEDRLMDNLQKEVFGQK